MESPCPRRTRAVGVLAALAVLFAADTSLGNKPTPPVTPVVNVNAPATFAKRPRARRVIPRSVMFKAKLQRWLPKLRLRRIGLRRRLRNLTAGVVSLGVIAGSMGSFAAPAPPTAVQQAIRRQEARAPAVYRRVRGALGELAEKQLYREHEFKVVDVDLGEHLEVGFRVKAQPIRVDDPIVAGDANRSWTAGKSMSWVLLGGGLHPKAGLSIPVGPGTLAFSAEHMIGYTVLAPYSHKAASIVEAGRNLTVDLPLTLEKLLAQKRGTEVVLLGKATYTATASAGKNWTLATLGDAATVGAHVGASSSASKLQSVAVRIKRLEGSKVSIRVEQLDANQLSSSLAAHVGVDSHLRKMIEDRGEGLQRKAMDLIAKRADTQIERWLRAGVRSSFTTRSDRNVIASHTVDLARGESHSARLKEQGRSESSHHQAYLGPMTVFSRISAGRERHGALDTRWGQMTYDRAPVTDSRTMIWPLNHVTGDLDTLRELVHFKYPGRSPEAYLRMRHTVKNDRHTSENDVRRFVGLAHFFGARPQNAGEVVRIARLGKTDRVVDIYINDAGLQKLAGAAPAELRRAFAAAYEKLERPAQKTYTKDRPWTTTPWLNTSHRRHADVMRMLELGPNQHDAKSWPVPGEARHTTDYIYHEITNRDLARDHAAYKEQKQLVTLQRRLARADSPAERASVFARAQKDLGLDLFREAAMIATVAGPEHVVVNRLAIEGKRGSVVFMHEGAIQDPQGVVNRILADPAGGWQP
jgi:hypothetical protein